MKRKILACLSFVMISCFLLALPQTYQQKYDDLKKLQKESLEGSKSREELKKLWTEYQAQLEALLKTIQSEKADDALGLLSGRILLDLNRTDYAEKEFDSLIGKTSPLALQAKLFKVQILLIKEKSTEALALFKEIEPQVPHDEELRNTYFKLIFNSLDPGVLKEYSNKLLAEKDVPEWMVKSIQMRYIELANMETEAKRYSEAAKYLDEGIRVAQDPLTVKMMESTKKQLGLFGKPAPVLSAETWLQSNPLVLEELKGKVVLIDFWAPWCGPCRGAFPMLEKAYAQFKEKGLIIIGLTKLYENYTDDISAKGKVTKEEEIDLIGQFVKRFSIPYPIAISHQVKDNSIFEAYCIFGIPTIILIDKSGKIDDIQVGLIPSRENELFLKIEKLVNS